MVTGSQSDPSYFKWGVGVLGLASRSRERGPAHAMPEHSDEAPNRNRPNPIRPSGITLRLNPRSASAIDAGNVTRGRKSRH